MKISQKDSIGLVKVNEEPIHLLCIQDTTEFNYTDHIDRIKGDDMDHWSYYK